MIVGVFELFHSNGCESFSIDLRDCSWRVCDSITGEELQRGLFLVADRQVIQLWQTLPMPDEIKEMFMKHGFDVTTCDTPKSMYFGDDDMRASLTFVNLQVFAVLDFNQETKIRYAGTYELKDGTKEVIDIDGVFGLPRETAAHLRSLGYNLKKIQHLIVTK